MLLVVVEFHQLCGPLIYVCTLVMLHGSTLHMCREYSVYYNRSFLECPPVARHSYLNQNSKPVADLEI